MKNWFYPLFLFAAVLTADEGWPPSNEPQMRGPLDEVGNRDLFYLIQGNIENLKNRGASSDSANELINLIEEGYKIDPVNMLKLIDTLIYRDASDNAASVLLKAIEHNSFITTDHLSCLIATLAHVDASDNATKVLLKAIEQGVKIASKERLLLAEISKVVDAKKNVEKIRKALHERHTGS